MDLDLYFSENEVEVEEKHAGKRSRAYYREKAHTKAKRKQRLAMAVGGFKYEHFNQYSKGKIHCSCPLCAFNHPKKKKNYTISDRKKMDEIADALNDYIAG